MSDRSDAYRCIINEDMAIIYDINDNEINRIESGIVKRKTIDKHDNPGRIFMQKRQDYIKNVINYISYETIIEGSDSYVSMVKMERLSKSLGLF